MAALQIDRAGSEARETLKAFQRRASEAEKQIVSGLSEWSLRTLDETQLQNVHMLAADRLSRLEAALANGGDSELLKTVSELQSKLEDVTAELASEKQKAQKLAVENGKLEYRVTHLVRSIRESD
ncbi:unnamed protein product [Linum tenue]|uniref:Uncharacterized protein n=1 Tax=Linum tenue TaxID=586396 RepID=A0AAV0GPK3_9ROSI|nr:unnamed protein product [Linum tenue]